MRLFRDGYLRYALFIMTAILLVRSYATNVSVSTVALQDQYGLTFAIPSAFTAIDQGFVNITLTQTGSTQPCLWINETTCNTALTSPHLEYSVVLRLNTPPSLLTTYTVTIAWSQNGGSLIQMGQLAVSVPALALAGQQMTFTCDTGGTSLTSQMSVKVTVN
jgi:hypothetical protein